MRSAVPLFSELVETLFEDVNMNFKVSMNVLPCKRYNSCLQLQATMSCGRNILLYATYCTYQTLTTTATSDEQPAAKP